MYAVTAQTVPYFTVGQWHLSQGVTQTSADAGQQALSLGGIGTGENSQQQTTTATQPKILATFSSHISQGGESYQCWVAGHILDPAVVNPWPPMVLTHTN